jgi:hypothetical protein
MELWLSREEREFVQEERKAEWCAHVRLETAGRATVRGSAGEEVAHTATELAADLRDHTSSGATYKLHVLVPVSQGTALKQALLASTPPADMLDVSFHLRPPFYNRTCLVLATDRRRVMREAIVHLLAWLHNNPIATTDNHAPTTLSPCFQQDLFVRLGLIARITAAWPDLVRHYPDKTCRLDWLGTHPQHGEVIQVARVSTPDVNVLREVLAGIFNATQPVFSSPFAPP